MILEIKKYPDPVLKTRVEEIKGVDQEVRELAQNMVETMSENDGVGLAANQVGLLKRIIVVQTEEGPQVFINPRITQKGKETTLDQEGCLSLPKNLFLNIRRVKEVRVSALDISGSKIEIKAQDLVARIFQHEIDHINGILIIDRIGFWQKLKVKRQLKGL